MMKSDTKDKLNICVVSLRPFYPEEEEAPLTNFLQILESVSNKIYVICGQGYTGYKLSTKIHLTNIKRATRRKSPLIKYLGYSLAQLRYSLQLFKLSRNIDVVVFYLAGVFVLPAFTAKLLRKKVVAVALGLDSSGAKIDYGKNLLGFSGLFFSSVFRILEKIMFSLSDQIAAESESAVEFLGLGRYKNKVFINGGMYIDTHFLTPKRGVAERGKIIGYAGRLNEVKGIRNFVKSVPLILKEHNDAKFLVGGDGPLFDGIKEELKDNKLDGIVELCGWISHDGELPDYLNRLKLLVVPSYSEGLPGIVQEAMACGTPVLATSVGGVPDLIKNGETGFIMENNSPECIARNAISALEHPRLDEITQNARRLIEREYNYDVMVGKCREALGRLIKT
jgi:glycosyltransferase involved in cell wall biosynthesis